MNHSTPLRLLSALALTLAAATVVPIRASGVVLDAFRTGPFALSANAGTSTGAGQVAADAIGGNRAETLNNPYGPPNGLPTATATLATGSGALILNSGYVALTLGYGVRYSGGGLSGDGSTALNLDLRGTDHLSFNFSAVSGGSVRIYATYQTLGGGTLSNGNQGDPAFIVSGPGMTDLYYTSLRTPGGGASSSYSLADVDFINFSIQPNVGVSFTLAGISAVPEPTPLSLLSGCTAAGALLSLARRRGR